MKIFFLWFRSDSCSQIFVACGMGEWTVVGDTALDFAEKDSAALTITKKDIKQAVINIDRVVMVVKLKGRMSERLKRARNKLSASNTPVTSPKSGQSFSPGEQTQETSNTEDRQTTLQTGQQLARGALQTLNVEQPADRNEQESLVGHHRQISSIEDEADAAMAEEEPSTGRDLVLTVTLQQLIDPRAVTWIKTRAALLRLKQIDGRREDLSLLDLVKYVRFECWYRCGAVVFQHVRTCCHLAQIMSRDYFSAHSDAKATSTDLSTRCFRIVHKFCGT